MHTHFACLYAILTVLLPGSGIAQNTGAISAGWNKGGPITIRTDIDSALVIIDSTRVGITPLTIDEIAPGLHSITLVHPDVENWLASNISDTFFVSPGEVRTLRYVFEPRYMVLSSPFDADVLIGDSTAGTTPLMLTNDQALKGFPIRIRKEGYETTNLDLLDAHRGVLAVPLKRVWQEHGEDQSPFTDLDKTESNHLRLYITGAATILSGAAAAFFKVRADERYGLYRKTGDPSLLEKTNQLDTASAVALGATQVGLALIAYFLLSE